MKSPREFKPNKGFKFSERTSKPLKNRLVLSFKINLILIIIIIISILSVNSTTSLGSQNIDLIGLNSVISIYGNSEFRNLAIQEEWSGNGTPTNPYLIINLTINASGERIIDINNVDLHFQIKNCTFIGAGLSFFSVKNGALICNSIIDEPEERGIYLENCANFIIEMNFFSRITLINVEKGQILNNTITDEHGGYRVKLDKCSDIQIELNEINELMSSYIYIPPSHLTKLPSNSIYTEGISVKTSSNIIILRNKIYCCNNGITSVQSSKLIVANNLIYGIENDGILLSHTDLSTIEDNNVSYAFFGITVSESDYNDITNNSLGFIFCDCIYVYNSKQNSISKNELFGDEGPWFTAEGIYFQSSQNNTFKENYIHNCWIGIMLDYSSNNLISKNIINDSDDYGMWIHFSSDENKVSENKFYRNSHGIVIEESNGNSVIYNEISENYYGIYLNRAHYNSIDMNNIYDNHGHGIHLQSSNGNTITGNKIFSNYGKDFYQNDSSDNILEGNNLYDNESPGWMYPLLLVSLFIIVIFTRKNW